MSARGERARASLKEAALTVLERDGYHKMRIADVTGEAGVAQGLFYHYFKDLKSLTLEVLTDFAMASNDPLAIEKNVLQGRLVRAHLRAQPGRCAQLCQASGRHALPAAAGG